MNKWWLGMLVISMMCVTSSFGNAKDQDSKMLVGVSHWKQSTVRIQAEKVIYFDPFRVNGTPHDADIVFVTHTHSDHFSIFDLKKVMKSDSVLVITTDGLEEAQKEGFNKVTPVVPNKSYTIAGINFTTTPAYNTNKSYHPKTNNWVGYIVQINNYKYYMAGDTDLIPEMKDIKADVAFLPVGGTYTMTATEAANAANIIKPKVAVPIHFGDVVGTIEDAKNFVALLDKQIDGVILKQ